MRPMDYRDIAQQTQEEAVEYTLWAGEDLTAFAWRVEERWGDYGRTWRDIAYRLGILDPFQVAGIPREGNLVGGVLLPGMKYKP